MEDRLNYRVFSPSCSNYGGLRRRSDSVNPRSLDRFIPNRRSSDLDSAYFKLCSPQRAVSQSSSPGHPTPGTPVYRRRMSVISGGRSEDRVLVFSPRQRDFNVSQAGGFTKPTDNQVFSTPTQRGKRVLPRSPERVLDMPEMRDTLFSQALDWSKTNNISVALTGNEVYSWNHDVGTVKKVPFAADDTVAVTAVVWDPQGYVLAIGDEGGGIKTWDSRNDVITRLTPVNAGCQHWEVMSLTWAPDGKVFFSGHGCDCIQLCDIRTGETSVFGTLQQQTGVSGGATGPSAGPSGVFGLQLSADGVYLACGGNQQVNIWDMRSMEPTIIAAHSSPVKALAWCPWQSRLLATGGTEDGQINVWNTITGTKVASTDTKSQVCSMVWSPETRELVTGHGGERPKIYLWKYPHLEHVGSLAGHDSRVLHLALSPNNKTLASCCGDECLMMWDCFEVNKTPSRRRSQAASLGSPKNCSPLMRMMTLR